MTDFYFEQMANKYCLDLNIYEEKDFKEIFITVGYREFLNYNLIEIESIFPGSDQRT